MTAPKLSICIATLNRGAFIGATLDSILTQATPEVEVVIVDGASTDNTQAVVGERQRRSQSLNYVRLPTKGGVDQDYCRAVDEARGEYCWLLSDDDIVKPGAVQAVLQAISGEYSLVVVNSEMRSFDLSQVLDARRLAVESDRIYQPDEFRRLFCDVGYYLSFIGAVVIRRDLWEARDKRGYFGTEFVHVGVIFQRPLPGPALVMATPWLSLRYGNTLWAPRYFEIWMIKWPQLVWSFSSFSPAEMRSVYAAEPWRNLKTLLILRAQGVYSQREYSRWVHPRLSAGPVRWMAKAIAWLPGPFVNVIVLFYFSMIRPASPLRLAELRDSRFHYRQLLSRLAFGHR